MPRITFKETVTKEVEIPMDTLYNLIDRLTEKERTRLLERLRTKRVKLSPFKKGKIDPILSDFKATDLYEDTFLKDLEDGLKRSSVYK